ncbi:MAG: hypothetical protein IPK83_17035 [Planctomycetes bacterium]|nr:hypothetical protein [Planctomycetota bacterium]
MIFAYTRAQAIEDGVLIDLTEWARETSFKVPVACTSEVWHRYITPPAGTREFGQSERGRAHDTLWMLFVAIKRRSSDNQLNSRTDGGKGEARRGNDQLLYEVIFLQAPQHHETIQLKSICGPGDNGEPVITIMLPNED